MTLHAAQRAVERYKARMTANDRNILLMKIACGDARCISEARRTDNNQVWLVWWNKIREEVAVVVSPDQERLLTILPRDRAKNTIMAERLAEALGGGADA